jgi:bifunctional lysine-specific demethylase and histidyl-hydroxylase NO66
MCLGDELFQCDTGCNAYITPYPDNTSKVEQGFAPHYDDIDAFMLQLNGKKTWNLCLPLKKSDLLCIESSKDFTKEQVEKMQKIFTGDLNKGDLLYMPRGIVHYGSTAPTKDTSGADHSLHVTVSNQQRNTWHDFILNNLPAQLEANCENDIALRQSLPTNVLSDPA